MEEVKNEAMHNDIESKAAEGPDTEKLSDGGSQKPAEAGGEGFTPRRAIQDLCAIYLIYVIYTLIKTLRAGEVKENHVVWVIFAIVLFAAGVIWLILPEIRKLFKKKEP